MYRDILDHMELRTSGGFYPPVLLEHQERRGVLASQLLLLSWSLPSQKPLVVVYFSLSQKNPFLQCLEGVSWVLAGSAVLPVGTGTRLNELLSLRKKLLCSQPPCWMVTVTKLPYTGSVGFNLHLVMEMNSFKATGWAERLVLPPRYNGCFEHC